jgi:hypothetical protein
MPTKSGRCASPPKGVELHISSAEASGIDGNARSACMSAFGCIADEMCSL